MQCLGVGVNGNKINSANAGFYHTVNGSAASSANTYNFYSGKGFNRRLYGFGHLIISLVT
jgi:hypothetical protein